MAIADSHADAATPVVSVIVPVYNRSRTVKELIESIWDLDFDLSKIEIVVADDACTDDTPRVLSELQKKSPCRFLIHSMERNGGPVAARNAAVKRSGGAYLAFTDSDCRVDGKWLRNSLACFAPDVAFVAGAVLNKPEQPVSFFARMRPGVAAEHASYPTENIVYRRAVLLEMGGFDERLCFRSVMSRVNECADTDLAWRVIGKGYRDRGYRHRFCADAVVYHEVERQRPLNWIVEPMRLFVVPLIVKRHPESRARLLYRKLFWYPGSVRFYIACVVLPFALALSGWKGALIVVAGFWLLRVLIRAVPRRKPSYSLLQWGCLALRQAAMSAGLIYGSIRFRCLVL
jgi:glycosyltransferase involved in cell wall biosynthesis